MIVYRTRTCNTSCNTITLTYTTITSFMFDGLLCSFIHLKYRKRKADTHRTATLTLNAYFTLNTITTYLTYINKEI